MARFTVSLTGVSPLLMHNPRLADPDDEIVQEISKINSKQKKTAEDREAREHWEFVGGLYINDEGPFMPSLNIKKCWYEAAKLQKLGTTVERAVIMTTVSVPLEYKGPKTAEELWQSQAHRFRTSVGIKRGAKTDRVQRMRPMFPDWSLTTSVEVLTQFMDTDAFIDVVSTAGMVEGLGEGRRVGHGRYTAIVKAAE